ncbi:hypothetical protein BD310DRAFT_913468, partial [Dichomitus squalens]
QLGRRCHITDCMPCPPTSAAVAENEFDPEIQPDCAWKKCKRCTAAHTCCSCR